MRTYRQRLGHYFWLVSFLSLLPVLGLAALPPARLPDLSALSTTLLYRSGPVSPSSPNPDLARIESPASDPVLPADLGNRALVLCWHTFLGKPSVPTDFSLLEFGAQLDAIRGLGYRFISVEDFLAGRIEGALNVIVTIDDGHRTVPLAIHQVLEPRGIAATLFVYPSILGTTDFAMSDTTLALLARSGVVVGAHGYHHLFVTEALFKEDPKAFMDEIHKSKLKSESLSTRFVLTYAYPYGALSPRTKSEVRRAGFSAAFAVKPGFVYARRGLNDEYELPRLVVTRDGWKPILALLARNAGIFPPP
ncbi:MAG: polysaccharide deacetylase family protein [Spirochaetota bacterium]